MIATAGDFSAAGAAADLSVMSSALTFDMSSNPSPGITNQLTVPITATVTTTPEIVRVPRLTDLTAREVAPIQPIKPINIISQFPTGPIQLPVGQGGNTPTTTTASPSLVQEELNAFIPIEALLNTGITAIPIGTAFSTQPLGNGAQFQANAPGTVLNLCDAHRKVYALPPINLPIADTGLSLDAGVQYVFSLRGTALAVRGSNGSALSATSKLDNPDEQHTYIGAIIYEKGLASVRLYPILRFPCLHPLSTTATGSRRMNPIRSASPTGPLSQPSTFSIPARSSSPAVSKSRVRSRPTTQSHRLVTSISAVFSVARRL
jgi:hypothetical protein